MLSNTKSRVPVTRPLFLDLVTALCENGCGAPNLLPKSSLLGLLGEEGVVKINEPMGVFPGSGSVH